MAEGKGIPMISSFLNLCRVCPMPTDDKVNSEYKRNFTWHDGYQSAQAGVIKKPPSIPGSAIEPSLSRRKKHPDLPYRTHELLFDYEEGESSDSLDAGGSLNALASGKGDADSRARSEERNFGKSRPSPRSRSADSTVSRRLRTAAIPDAEIQSSTILPAESENAAKKSDEKQPLMIQSYPPSTNPRGNPGTPGDESIPKTTEYRSQFVAWPLAPGEMVSTARKSASMGFITPQMMKKDFMDKETDGPNVELWGVRPEGGDDDDAALDAVKRGRIKKTEYKSKFRPFSAYTYVDGGWKKATKLIKDDTVAGDLAVPLDVHLTLPLDIEFSDHDVPSDVDPNSWYCEVVERLKKADQYRVRSHGGGSLYGEQQLPLEFLSHVRDRTILSPVSVASTSRTWKDERPSKERPRPAPVPVHQRKEKKKEMTESPEHARSREGSTKKKSSVEKTTVRPKSAEPVIPHTKENKSPKHQPKSSRPRAPRDLPVHGHGDLSGRKKAAARQAAGSPHARPAEKSSPMGSKPRAVPRPTGAVGVVNGDDGKIWMKPESSKIEGEGPKGVPSDEQDAMLMNGFPESDKEQREEMVNGEVEDSVHNHRPEEDNGQEDPCPRPITKPPIRVPLTTVKSPEEVTGVRSPDPESWTVPLEIGKGLHWMDGKTPDGAPQKTPPILLSKRFKEPAIAAKGQRDLVLCDPGSASEDIVDL